MSNGGNVRGPGKKAAPVPGKFMATAFPRGFAYLQSWARTLKALVIKVRCRSRKVERS